MLLPFPLAACTSSVQCSICDSSTVMKGFLQAYITNLMCIHSKIQLEHIIWHTCGTSSTGVIYAHRSKCMSISILTAHTIILTACTRILTARTRILIARTRILIARTRILTRRTRIRTAHTIILHPHIHRGM